MTQRIYYAEPYRRSFDAKVLAVDTVAGHTHVTLDQTAFYPTSGGQPFDTGTLGGAAVTEVIDRDDGTIGHVVSGSLKTGDVVSGEIDWARRFDHMQQHTGQHVLSAAFDRLFGVRTESFHGAASSTIDLAREVSPNPSRRPKTMRIMWLKKIGRSRQFATAEKEAAMPLEESARPDRLADRCQDHDLSHAAAHIERTGAIGIIAIALGKFARSRVSSCAATARCNAFRVGGRVVGGAEALVGTPIEIAASIDACRKMPASSGRSAVSRRSWPSTKGALVAQAQRIATGC